MIRATALSLLALFAVNETVSTRLSTVARQAEDEQTIWSLEKAYFAHLAKGDLEALEGFWHADFIGWPSHSPEPVDRSTARQSIEELLADTEVLSIEMHRLAVVIRGDVAVTHCFVDIEQQDSETEGSSSSLRVTHTWLREDGSWKVIGGMSAHTT